MKGRKKKGFTLIEIVVAVAIFSIIMLAVTSILINVINLSSINKKTYNADSSSKIIFETIRENRPSKLATPSSLNGSFKGEVDNANEIRNFVVNQILGTGVRNTVVDPSDFGACKSVNDKQYSIGVHLQWNDAEGFYEIETWVWDTKKGESTLVNRKTYLTPR